MSEKRWEYIASALFFISFSVIAGAGIGYGVQRIQELYHLPYASITWGMWVSTIIGLGTVAAICSLFSIRISGGELPVGLLAFVATMGVTWNIAAMIFHHDLYGKSDMFTVHLYCMMACLIIALFADSEVCERYRVAF